MEYDDHGLRTKNYIEIGSEGKIEPYTITYTYDEKGRNIHSVNSYGNEALWEYNDHDDIIKMERYNPKGEKYEQSLNEYDDQYRLTKHTYETFESGQTKRYEVTIYEYEGGDQATKILHYTEGELAEAHVLHYDADGNQIGTDTYDADGNLIRSWTKENGEIKEIDYTK